MMNFKWFEANRLFFIGGDHKWEHSKYKIQNSKYFSAYYNCNTMPSDKIVFKNSLKQFCQRTIEQRIAAAKETIQNVQDAANNEEKSSAGDKYETGRAMGHLQKDMHARQLTAYLKELADLHGINAGLIYSYATAGAFIETDVASFFIVAGLGKQMVEGQTIYFLSPHAPLAGILQNKKKGDSFPFNKNYIVITEIY